MVDYLTKTSITNLKEFTVGIIIILGGNQILPLYHKNTIYTVSLITNQWERLSLKTPYSMTLANNTKRVSSKLFGCSRAKLEPLRRGHLQHLMFITELLLVWPVGHIDPHITDWITKPSQIPWTGNLPNWMWRLNIQNHS